MNKYCTHAHVVCVCVCVCVCVSKIYFTYCMYEQILHTSARNPKQNFSLCLRLSVSVSAVCMCLWGVVVFGGCVGWFVCVESRALAKTLTIGTRTTATSEAPPSHSVHIRM